MCSRSSRAQDLPGPVCLQPSSCTIECWAWKQRGGDKACQGDAQDLEGRWCDGHHGHVHPRAGHAMPVMCAHAESINLEQVREERGQWADFEEGA